MTTQAPALPAQRLRRPLLERLLRNLLVEARLRWLVDALAFGVTYGVLLAYFRPSLIFANTTTNGGDTGAHIFVPWYLKEHLLPHGLIAGWSPGWYAGFPILQFYFPLVSLFQAVVAYVIPYNVAFKLGTLLGTFFLPAAVYMTCRLLRFRFPTPIIGAVLSLVFLFMRSFSIYGGNIPSSLAGEYSFALSLGLALVFLGLAWRVATEERSRPVLAGVVLGLTALAHIIPLLTALTAMPLLAVLAVRTHGVRRATLRLGTTLAIGFGLTAFWSIPFVARLAYTTDLNWIQTRSASLLVPRGLWVYLIMAASGAVLALFSLDRRLLLFVFPAGASLLLFRFYPQGGSVFNARFLPFWYLAVVIVAAYFLGTVTAYATELLGTTRWRSLAARYRLSLALPVAVVAIVTGITAGSVLGARGTSYIDDWIQWNYEGYQSKSTWPQFRQLLDKVRALPPGRVMWEPSNDYNQFGTPVALMALPYFTGHPSMEGINFESSLTTDYHFLMAAELADHPSNPWPGLPYPSFDMERGIDHMEMFDVRYYLAWSARAKEAAAASSRLRKVGDAGGFSIFALKSSAQVVVAKNQPVVLQGGSWKQASIAWYLNRDDDDVPLVKSGPKAWARIGPLPPAVPRTPLAHGGETLPAVVKNDEISFDTNAIGEPTLVRTSYFPNWRVDGAKGPYQVSPSLMLVIPTQRHVRLHWERTWVEWLGIVLTLGTLALLALLLPFRRLASGRRHR